MILMMLKEWFKKCVKVTGHSVRLFTSKNQASAGRDGPRRPGQGPRKEEGRPGRRFIY